MAWSPTLTKLRNLLADRYMTPQDARRVIVEADLDPAHIAFDAKAVNNWHNILTQAELRGKVSAIVEIAISEFNNDQVLSATYQEYISSTGQSVASSSAASPDNSEGTNIGTQINTGGGAYIAGNVNTGGGDFVGRDQVNKSNSAGQPANFDERAELEALLQQHKRNLLRLRQQKANYAYGEEPLRLLNQIDHEEQEIAKLESMLS